MTGSLEGRVCVVTGANSGIGYQASLGLARAGAHVVMVCRNAERGEAARDLVRDACGHENVDLVLGDLSRLSQVRDVAGRLLAANERIHVLLNNAGAIFDERRVTEDGLEMTFALNHMAYFVMTKMLLERLKESAPARIVNVSSEAHRMGQLDLDDLQMEEGYTNLRAYGLSKLANIHFTFELARQLEGSGVTANCMHPGVVATNFGRSGSWVMKLLTWIGRPVMISSEKGADTAVWLCSSPDVENVSGKYFLKRKERRSSRESRDEGVSRRLWEISEELAG